MEFSIPMGHVLLIIEQQLLYYSIINFGRMVWFVLRRECIKRLLRDMVSS